MKTLACNVIAYRSLRYCKWVYVFRHLCVEAYFLVCWIKALKLVWKLRLKFQNYVKMLNSNENLNIKDVQTVKVIYELIYTKFCP